MKRLKRNWTETMIAGFIAAVVLVLLQPGSVAQAHEAHKWYRETSYGLGSVSYWASDQEFAICDLAKDYYGVTLFYSGGRNWYKIHNSYGAGRCRYVDKSYWPSNKYLIFYVCRSKGGTRDFRGCSRYAEAHT